MPAPRHPTHAQYQQQERTAAPTFSSKGKAAQQYQLPADGLAISYEQHTAPLYHADQSEQAMGWDRNDLPIPRNVTKGNGFLAAYDPETDTSNRVDSVFDAYADMYADMDDDDEEQTEQEQGGGGYDSSSTQDAQPQLEDYSSQPQAREPWDQRGKNGLYGGGGRGADDRETGWVSNYGLGGGRAAGVEEDLRYEEEQVGRTARLDSRDTYRGGRRRSSSGTEHSSYGPVTPTNTSFSGPAGVPHIANHESGYRQGNSPPSTQEIKPTSKLSFSTPPPMPRDAQPPTSPPQTLKKKTPPPKTSPSGVVAPLVNPMQHVDTSLLNTTRRKSAFKWSRSKKPPVISNPILPDGFVESLGMETFALTPGCSAPNHLLHHSSSSADLNSEHASSASSVKSGGKNDKDQNRAPRPRKIPNRPNFLPALKLGAPDLNIPVSHPDGTSSLPRPTESPIPTPVRLPLNALRHSSTSGDEHNSSDYSHEISDAFRRLSRDSEVSYAPSSKTLASAEKTRRLYFNGIREERARQADQEVQANRAPVLANAPAIPAVPTRYQDEVESPAPSHSTARHGSTDSAFRNPWGPSSGARQSGGSFHSNGGNSRRSFGTPQGFNNEPRGSISSHRTINQQPSSAYRHSYTRPKSSLTPAPVIEASESRDSSSYGAASSEDEEERQRDERERQGSTSSAYSENSNINDYLSSTSDDPSSDPSEDIYASYTSPPPPPPTTAPLRRKSLAPTAPLKLGRRQQQEEKVVPSAMGTTGPTGGFNNWGHEAREAPFAGFGGAARAEPDIIGGTGFRNPFG